MPRTPWLIVQSVRIYRLLLAAYPRSFRDNYGESMAQLFRDSALDAYGQRGLPGLVGVWLRLFADLMRSAFNQHVEEWAMQTNSRSLNYVLRQWAFLIGTFFSAGFVTIRYTIYLIHHHLFLACLALSLVALGICLPSCYERIGIITFPLDVRLNISNGVMEFSRMHSLEPPMPEEQWRIEKGYQSISPPYPKAWDLSFSWHEIGTIKGTGMVAQTHYWLLRFPLWLIPIALLLPWIFKAVRPFLASVSANPSWNCALLQLAALPTRPRHTD